MLSSSISKYLFFLIWISFVYYTAIFIFTSGFLLRRQVLANRTECSTKHCSQPAQVFSKAVVLLVDALRYDFCTYNSSLRGHSVNKLPVIHQHCAASSPGQATVPGKLYRFLADPPTTTMQRLKGLTTGSLPTFIDVSSNFGSYSVAEDNIVDQLVSNGRRVVFAGDDTWTHLYPSSFTKQFPMPSFDVWDLDTVDRDVTKVLKAHLKTPDTWDVFIGHYLGVDHAGHKYGPHHPEMARKLSEVNSVLETVIRQLPPDTVLLVFGDHGMTEAGDHGGDSESEVTAGLFVYSPGLGFPSPQHGGDSVAQIDLVPSLALLLGVPIPFSNLGAVIEDLFVPTSLFKNSGSRHGGYSSEDLVNFRLPYVKHNVHQVYRYLTAYLAQGGSFPEAANSRIRQLASQVINKPGALSHRQLLDLVTHSRQFLAEARAMAQSVWVEFNVSAMSQALNLLTLHTAVLVLVVLKPPSRLLTMLISRATLALATLGGGFLGVTISCACAPASFYPLVLGCAAAASTAAQGISLLWRLRQSLASMVASLAAAGTGEAAVLGLCYAATLLTNFSNSFVVLQAHTLAFLLVTVLVLQLYKHRHNPRAGAASLAAAVCCGLVTVSRVYVRCREEQGPACPPSDHHKPLATLPATAGTHKNWRYCGTNLCLLATCAAAHWLLSRGGNLNGISVPVLVAGYAPWIIVILMLSYWALQAFPISLVSKLLPWQQNLLAQAVLLLSLAGLIILVINPKLVYLIPKKRPLRLNQLVAKQENVASYFNYLKSNWRETLGEGGDPRTIAYGLGTCLSSLVMAATFLLALVSMLLLGDGQAPALCLHLATSACILLVTAPPRLQPALPTASLFRVPWAGLVLWYCQDLLSFYTTGHQPTFPHIQWSAAFVATAGAELGGDTVLGHLVPGLLVGWNTFSSVIISGVSLPLLILAPPLLWLHLPALRPRPPATNGSVAGPEEPLIGDCLHSELMKGEALFLDRVEETRAAALSLACTYTVMRAGRLVSTVLAAAVLRRHLMVWKIFAPNFIFEAVGFCVSLVSVTLGFLIFTRALSVLNKWYCKIQKL